MKAGGGVENMSELQDILLRIDSRSKEERRIATYRHDASVAMPPATVYWMGHVALFFLDPLDLAVYPREFLFFCISNRLIRSALAITTHHAVDPTT